MPIKTFSVYAVPFEELKPDDMFLLASDFSLSRQEGSPEHLPMLMRRTDDSDPEIQWEPVFEARLPDRPREAIVGGKLGPENLVIQVQ